MTIPDLLVRLRQAGVVLSARGDRLSWKAPAGVMTPDLLATMKAGKGELLAVLNGDYLSAAAALLAQVQDDGARADLREQFEERAGIIEYDGNLPRDEAERLAYEQLAQALGPSGGRKRIVANGNK